MRITAVEAIPVDIYLFVKVHTDAGITGLGESGTWGYLEASQKVVEKFGQYLVGQDPLRIEHHWQYMYRSSHFRGAAIMGALSAPMIAAPRKWLERYMYCQWCSILRGSCPIR